MLQASGFGEVENVSGDTFLETLGFDPNNTQVRGCFERTATNYFLLYLLNLDDAHCQGVAVLSPLLLPCSSIDQSLMLPMLWPGRT